jgi:hypothetical protein
MWGNKVVKGLGRFGDMPISSEGIDYIPNRFGRPWCALALTVNPNRRLGDVPRIRENSVRATPVVTRPE